MKSIAILIDYFGQWPKWFPIFLETCRTNPTVDWIFFTDCPYETFDVENVKFFFVSKEDYQKYVSEKLKLTINVQNAYKINDLKPCYGYLHFEAIKDYDFFGYGDIDVIYGDLRKFLTEEILQHDVISSHTWCISGHFALLKNVHHLRTAFMRVKNWQEYLQNHKPMRFDEDVFSTVFRYPKHIPASMYRLYDAVYYRSKIFRQKLHFSEQFSTPLTPSRWRDGSFDHPTTWYWHNGRLTNDKDGDVEFQYLHFMNYVSARYMNPIYGNKAPWHGLEKLLHFNVKEITKGIKIDHSGFHLSDR